MIDKEKELNNIMSNIKGKMPILITGGYVDIFVKKYGGYIIKDLVNIDEEKVNIIETDDESFLRRCIMITENIICISNNDRLIEYFNCIVKCPTIDTNNELLPFNIANEEIKEISKDRYNEYYATKCPQLKYIKENVDNQKIIELIGDMYAIK